MVGSWLPFYMFYCSGRSRQSARTVFGKDESSSESSGQDGAETQDGADRAGSSEIPEEFTAEDIQGPP